MDEARLTKILGGFPKARIAVVGDFFLDKLLLIDRGLDEPSLETGLTAYQVVGKRISPGAAGTVTNNLSALGVGELWAVGVRGDDGEGYELEQGLRATGVRTEYLVKCASLFTPTYTKPLFQYDSGLEEANRLDIRNRKHTPQDVEDAVIANLRKAALKVDAIIALDQVVEEDTGVITRRVREELARLGRVRKNLILYADSRAHIADFRDIVIKCNHLEAMHALSPDSSIEADEDGVNKAALAMAAKTGKPAFVTWGARGIVAAQGGQASLVPAVKVEGPVDICGAGDAATAGIVSSLCAGAAASEAAFVANLAASVTIRQIGKTGTATREQILAQYRESFRA